MPSTTRAHTATSAATSFKCLQIVITVAWEARGFLPLRSTSVDAPELILARHNLPNTSLWHHRFNAGQLPRARAGRVLMQD